MLFLNLMAFLGRMTMSTEERGECAGILDTGCQGGELKVSVSASLRGEHLTVMQTSAVAKPLQGRQRASHAGSAQTQPPG